jgi:hypothetical protein
MAFGCLTLSGLCVLFGQICLPFHHSAFLVRCSLFHRRAHQRPPIAHSRGNATAGTGPIAACRFSGPAETCPNAADSHPHDGYNRPHGLPGRSVIPQEKSLSRISTATPPREAETFNARFMRPANRQPHRSQFVIWKRRHSTFETGLLLINERS